MSEVLVAYFSASGVTAGVADRLAKSIGADLFEIVPEQIYTNADLNWMDKKSRSSVEMNDRSSRPAISSKVENISQYSHVFAGFQYGGTVSLPSSIHLWKAMIGMV